MIAGTRTGPLSSKTKTPNLPRRTSPVPRPELAHRRSLLVAPDSGFLSRGFGLPGRLPKFGDTFDLAGQIPKIWIRGGTRLCPSRPQTTSRKLTITCGVSGRKCQRPGTSLCSTRRGTAASWSNGWAVENPRVAGRDPEGRSCFSFASFEDADGNRWLLQEITMRLPGREWK